MATKKPGVKVPKEFNAKMMTSAKGKPKAGTISAIRKPAAKPAPNTFPNAPKPKLSVKVPAEWNAKTVYSGANMPRMGQPFTAKGRMAARGPALRGSSPNIGLSRSLVKEMRANIADVRPANKPAAKPAAKPTAPAPTPAAKPAAKPTAPATTTPRMRTTTSYGPPASQIKPKGAGQGSPLSNIQAAATKVTNTVKNAASQVSKGGVGTKLANLAKSPIAKNLGRAAVPIGIVAGLNEQLNPNSARNQRDAELLRRIGNKLQGKPAKPAAKPVASTSRFAGARDKAMAKAKGIKGSPVLGPKKVGPGKVGTIAQAFDRSFAAARKAGKSEFTFQGKRYNTKLA